MGGGDQAGGAEHQHRRTGAPTCRVTAGRQHSHRRGLGSPPTHDAPLKGTAPWPTGHVGHARHACTGPSPRPPNPPRRRSSRPASKSPQTSGTRKRESRALFGRGSQTAGSRPRHTPAPPAPVGVNGGMHGVTRGDRGSTRGPPPPAPQAPLTATLPSCLPSIPCNTRGPCSTQATHAFAGCSFQGGTQGSACLPGLVAPTSRSNPAWPLPLPGAPRPSPVGSQPKLFCDVIQRDQIPHVYGDRVVEVLGRRVCTHGVHGGPAVAGVEATRESARANTPPHRGTCPLPKFTTWTDLPRASQCVLMVSQ